MAEVMTGFRIDVGIAERPDLTPATKLVLAFVAAMVKAYGTCNATNTYMARCLGMQRRTVIRSLSALEMAGLIERTTTLGLGWATRPIKLGPSYPKKPEA